VIAGLLRVFDERRAEREQDDSKRLELLRRMRAAHVRISHAQKLIRAGEDARTYSKQMRGLMLVARDLEEIREDVKVTKGLYKGDDRGSIMTGIAQIIEFLEVGSREYVDWNKRENSLPEANHRQGRWLCDLIETRAPNAPKDPSDEDWEPPDAMPEKDECGLVLQPEFVSFMVGWLAGVVAGTSAGLAPASPPRPARPVAGVSDRCGDEGGEQVLDLVAGQRDEPQWW
jgi:hypothetical protein